MEAAGVMAEDGAEAIMEAIPDILALDEEEGEAAIKTTEEGAEEVDTTDTGTTRLLLTGAVTMRPLPQGSFPAPRPPMATEVTRDSEATEAMAAPGMEGAGGTLTMVTSSIRGQPGLEAGRRGQRGHAALSLATTNTNLTRAERRQSPEVKREQSKPRHPLLRRMTDLMSRRGRTLARTKVKTNLNLLRLREVITAPRRKNSLI